MLPTGAWLGSVLPDAAGLLAPTQTGLDPALPDEQPTIATVAVRPASAVVVTRQKRTGMTGDPTPLTGTRHVLRATGGGAE